MVLADSQFLVLCDVLNSLTNIEATWISVLKWLITIKETVQPIQEQINSHKTKN